MLPMMRRDLHVHEHLPTQEGLHMHWTCQRRRGCHRPNMTCTRISMSQHDLGDWGPQTMPIPKSHVPRSLVLDSPRVLVAGSWVCPDLTWENDLTWEIVGYTFPIRVVTILRHTGRDAMPVGIWWLCPVGLHL